MSQDIDKSIPNDLDEAERLFQLGEKFNGEGYGRNYAEAQKCFRKAAEAGHAGAQNALGYMYAKWDGNEENAAKAMMWFTKAAEQGNVAAMSALISRYAFGWSGTPNIPEAEKWYRKELEQNRKDAEQGDADAMMGLSWAYENGIIVDKNPLEAEKWKRKAEEQKRKAEEQNLEQNLKAAENGDAQSMLNIGKIYLIKNDFINAEKWCLKAVDILNTNAAQALEYFYLARRDVIDCITARNNNEAMAEKWNQIGKELQRKAADSGDAWSRFALYSDVKGLQDLADKGDVRAMIRLGDHCRDNDKDTASAEKWYRKALEQCRQAKEQGDPIAMGDLRYSLSRLDDKHQEREMRDWLVTAAECGNRRAMEELSTHWYCGKRIIEPESKRIEWSIKLAKAGDYRAMMRLGEMFGGKKGDIHQAMSKEWYLKAEEHLRTQLESPLCWVLGVADGFRCQALGNCCASLGKKEEAAKWYLKAVEHGSNGGLRNLKELNKPAWKKWLGL